MLRWWRFLTLFSHSVPSTENNFIYFLRYSLPTYIPEYTVGPVNPHRDNPSLWWTSPGT